ncbi:ASCH domain-containing protein [Amycolatopsis sp. DSM 110486]|uniref:ASCH domain-containing protein n=1 Tax=Amycolatopsis sp. DSM 110486 TaxID=2865832 RepID=UPI001C698398|nr:ASCH domain-containing protein [Amycolatopsis sp. DSM 110486]QYN17449.1 ASCH domain-containing protein [Amycolatopsis sp. DSM 110486]
MRALSIRQPWASLILAGIKTVENRSWPTKYLGSLVIHASRKIDRHALQLARMHGIHEFPTGGYLGAVDLTGCHHDEDCRGCTDFSEHNQFHWDMQRPRSLPDLIPGHGQLQFWTPPPEVLDAVARLDAARLIEQHGGTE